MNPVLISNAPAQTQKPSTRTDDRKEGSSFGAVLSGQIARHSDQEPSSKEAPKPIASHKATTPKAESKADDTTVPAPDGAVALPSAMLASLVQQNQITTATVGDRSDSAAPATGVTAQSGAATQAGVTALAGVVAQAGESAPGEVKPAINSEVKSATDVALTPTSGEAGKPSSLPLQTSASLPAPISANTESAASVDAPFVKLLDSAQIHTQRPDQSLVEPGAPSPLTTIAQPIVANQTNAAQHTTLTLTTPLSRKDWGDDFGQKITWLATHNQQSAELHLNPPQLGPLDVVIRVNGDQAAAFFSSPHAAVRDAVEQAMPKLREMMADNGITLGNTSVNDQSRENTRNSDQPRSGSNRADGISDTMATGIPQSVVLSTPTRRHNGLLDTFA